MKPIIHIFIDSSEGETSGDEIVRLADELANDFGAIVAKTILPNRPTVIKDGAGHVVVAGRDQVIGFLKGYKTIAMVFKGLTSN